MPVFYIGLILLTFFGAQLHWFPVGGYGEGFADHLYHLFLPALTLALSLSAILMRNLRAAVIEVLGAEYVDFARAKGLRATARPRPPRAAQRADLDRHAASAFRSARCLAAPSSPRRSSPFPASAG